MSTNNIGFYEDLTKIIFELSSNTHLISSAYVYFVTKFTVLIGTEHKMNNLRESGNSATDPA